ncbi:hypothetical protein [uncultured Prevotella sp.]|uniref:hypothetical protein n=1 Tax=uncultured Prevotella sp. TaxID=159272 RepID=UPI0025997451|nr:hypothetical protein [uncultured Prevotella sp.]
MKKILFLMCMLLCAISYVRADETTLSISEKLSNTAGDASKTIGDITFSFTGSGTVYQNAYVKMVSGSKLTVSASSGTISKIVIGYASGRSKTNSFTANTGNWADKTSTWTGSSNSVTLTAGDNGECSVSSVTVTYSSSSSLTFASSLQTAPMTDLGVQALKPNNTKNTVTYTSSNTKIAQVDGNGWIRFVNTGMTTITATDDVTKISGSYTLLVTAKEATTSVSGQTYTLTSDGKISNKHILDVPYMNMQVGQDGEITMAKSYGTNNYLGMTCLDRNGFVHVFVDNGLPTMGTYYIFKPSAKGKLTVNGVFFQNGTGTADAHIYEGTTQKGTISYQANYGVAKGSFELDAGKTYYLYVPTDDKKNDYDIFCLNSFTFASQYYFANKSVRVNNGAKNYTQAVTGGDGSNYTVKAYGSLTSAKVDNSGNVSWSGDGGALVVTASLNGSSDSYVITVPYSEHEWDFRNPNVKLEDLNANTTDWAVTYKVRQFDQTSKALTYLNVPVMANGTAIDGNNALYVPATAGLLFKSDANGFGSKITSWTDDLDIDGLTLDEKYALTYDKVDSVQLVTMYKGGVLTIPNLKKGQYIRMKWRRYSPNTGDHIKATNVTDLDGKSIDNEFNVGVPARLDRGDYGYEFFIVKEDDDVTFTQMDEGWTDIYDIKLSADKNGMLDTDGINLLTDLRLVEKGKENDNVKFANSIIYTDKTTVTYSQEPNILHAVTAMAPGDPKRGDTTDGTVKYSYEKKNGNIEASISEAGVLTVNSGQGVITITQDGVNSGYVLDRKKTDVTVYEKKTVSRDYPYTWDFQNNKTTADKFTDDEWNKNTDGSLTLNPKSWNYFEGNDIQTGSSDYAEARDLGINVPRDKVNSLTLVLGSGLKFGSNDNQILTIPTVPSGFKAYILAKMGDNGSIANGSTTLTGTDYTAGKSNGEKIFVVDGKNGGNIDLKVKNATIEKIGVTGTFKKLNAYNSKSYATEYRDHNEKYDLTGIFTNGKTLNVKYITGVDNDAHKAKTTSISIAPEKTGVILICSSTDNVDAIPLFVADINSSVNNMKTNLLKGTLTDTNQLESDGTNYVFTVVSYNLDANGNIANDDEGTNSTLGFYRVANNDNSDLAANKAYLHVPSSTSAKNFYVIEGIFDNGDTPTSIASVSDNAGSSMDEGCYYTLTGIRMNSRPTRAGIYIHNGKKIVIK